MVHFLEADSLDGLETRVNEAIKNGWRARGDWQVITTKYGSNRYVQAIESVRTQVFVGNSERFQEYLTDITKTGNIRNITTSQTITADNNIMITAAIDIELFIEEK